MRLPDHDRRYPDRVQKTLPIHPDTREFERAAERLAGEMRSPAVGVLHDFAVLLHDWQVSMILGKEDIEVDVDKLQGRIRGYYTVNMASDEALSIMRTQRENAHVQAQRLAQREGLPYVWPISRFTAILETGFIPKGVLEAFTDWQGVDRRDRSDGTQAKGKSIIRQRLLTAFGVPAGSEGASRPRGHGS